MTDSRPSKVAVIGLDCATPQLVFDAWRADLPNINRLVSGSMYGPIRSSDPPITVPAWTSMMTSKSPGILGFYGFRNRTGHSYDGLSFANGASVKEPAVWDILSAHDRKVICFAIPQTYPVKPVNGCMVGCFLTPSEDSPYAYPADVKTEIQQVAGGYQMDCKDFRTTDKGYLLRQIYEMSENHFQIVNHLVTTREWDFFMMVEMGPDRIHHGLWKEMDETHPRHDPSSPYKNAIKDYYVWLDGKIGELEANLGKDTAIILVSDHGCKKMDGGICFNEWLMREGYLTLKSKPEGIAPIGKCQIDWDRTIAWGDGGYYGRLFLNVKGREPNGTIDPERYEEVRSELIRKIEAIPDHNGNPIGTRVVRPEDIYSTVNGVAPDLIVYFGDLLWRSIGSVGHNTLHVFENDSGPDDANHDWHGIFSLNARDGRPEQRVSGLDIRDVAPTVLDLLGVPIPADMEGTSVLERARLQRAA